MNFRVTQQGIPQILFNGDNLRSNYKTWIQNYFKGLPGILWIVHIRNYLREAQK